MRGCHKQPAPKEPLKIVDVRAERRPSRSAAGLSESTPGTARRCANFPPRGESDAEHHHHSRSISLVERTRKPRASVYDNPAECDERDIDESLVIPRSSPQREPTGVLAPVRLPLSGEALMYLPLLRFSTDATMLAIEAQSVISVRLTQFAMGLGTSAESSLMVPKKFS